VYDVTSSSKIKGIICGMLLGDGSKKGYNNMYIGHSTKQQEYALFKKGLLERITNKPVHVRYISQGKYNSIRIYPKLCIEVAEVVGMLYQTGRKVITESLLDILTAEGIALWYMDDGSNSVKYHGDKFGGINVTLNTYTPLDETQLIANYFASGWGIQWHVNRDYRFEDSWYLSMGTKEGRKFFDILVPYIIPSMQYKLRQSLDELHKPPHVGEEKVRHSAKAEVNS